MAMADVPSVSIIQRFHGLVSRGISFGRDFILRLPPIKLLLPLLTKTRDFSALLHPQSKLDDILPDSSPTRIIIISLTYAPPPDGTGAVPGLHGPMNDFHIMLQRYDYLHGDTSGKFILLNDFNTEFRDSAGVEKPIPKTDTSKKRIKVALKNVMSATNKSSVIVFYYAGHGVEKKCQTVSGSTANALVQAIIAGDGELIYGPELQSWLSAGADPSASVTAIFDTCTSSGILGLPYQYKYLSERVQIKKVSDNEIPLRMVEIAAAQRGQKAYSSKIGGILRGRLTWSLTEHVKNIKDPTLEELVRYLHRHFETSEQQPQISSS